MYNFLEKPWVVSNWNYWKTDKEHFIIIIIISILIVYVLQKFCRKSRVYTKKQLLFLITVSNFLFFIQIKINQYKLFTHTKTCVETCCIFPVLTTLKVCMCVEMGRGVGRDNDVTNLCRRAWQCVVKSLTGVALMFVHSLLLIKQEYSTWQELGLATDLWVQPVERSVGALLSLWKLIHNICTKKKMLKIHISDIYFYVFVNFGNLRWVLINYLHTTCSYNYIRFISFTVL